MPLKKEKLIYKFTCNFTMCLTCNFHLTQHYVVFVCILLFVYGPEAFYTINIGIGIGIGITERFFQYHIMFS